ncbi:MAG: UMP kinase [Candidatus Colwellbacteria bacterium]|nr:UMP kinase [Candidatus Colwellbacteria bacterium]MBI3274291.1 UMP kinase [Candidatus Colwellbacteria bacterium]
MKNKSNRDILVLSLGGSLVVPHGEVDVNFLSKFNDFIRKNLKENPGRQIFIVVGGGQVARHYRDAGKTVLGHELTIDDLDWLGIHATRLNAHLLRTVFRDISHPYIIKHYDIIRKVSEPVAIAAGWKPGWSTDYDAVLLCEDYGADTVLNLSNIPKVFDKDPKNHKDAKPIDMISWKDYRLLVGNKWIPGMNAPFDPIASKKAEELGLRVVVLKGDDFKNLGNYLENKKFAGTIIE